MAVSDFWSENLQESIQAAGLQAKTLLCFVYDDSEISKQWDSIISDEAYYKKLHDSTVRLRLQKDTQEFGFLNGVCPIQHVPALVLINGGQIEEKLEANNVTLDQLKQRLGARYSSSSTAEDEVLEAQEETVPECLEFSSSSGRMRLPNNAYDALKEQTEKLLQQRISPKNILQIQLKLLDNIAALKPYVSSINTRTQGIAPELPEEAVNQLLNMPASALYPPQVRPASSSAAPARAPSAPTTTTTTTPNSNAASSTAPPETVASPQPNSQPARQTQSRTQQTQRTDYIRQQREREAAQRAERDRIKEQIKHDREERRRLDAVRKQSELETLRRENSDTSTPSSTDIRIQVRTFDGSTLRKTFAKSATIVSEVRPWIDEVNPDAKKVPYDLKIILTPLPNRSIGTEEEARSLPDLGIVGSATLIMVPVKGFVESYAGPSTGVAGSIVGGIVGAGGSVVNGVLGMLGWGSGTGSGSSTPTQASQTSGSRSEAESRDTASSANSSGSQAKVRTLADQRADEAKKRGNQLYNGNSLDFQGRKDDDKRD